MKGSVRASVALKDIKTLVRLEDCLHHGNYFVKAN